MLAERRPLPADGRDHLWRPGERYPHASRRARAGRRPCGAEGAPRDARRRDARRRRPRRGRRAPATAARCRARPCRPSACASSAPSSTVSLSLEEAAARMKARTRALVAPPAHLDAQAAGGRPGACGRAAARGRRGATCSLSSRHARGRVCARLGHLTGGVTGDANVAGPRQGPVLQVAGPRQQLHRACTPKRCRSSSRWSACGCSATATSASARTASWSSARRAGRTASRSRIFNPDGSQAEMCGNGVRMVARKLQMEGSTQRRHGRARDRRRRDRPQARRRLHGHRRHGHRALRRREAQRLRRETASRSLCTPPGAASPSRSSTSATRTP